MQTVQQRLLGKTVEHDGPLVFIGALSTFGYGHLEVNGRIHNTHRLNWELANGEVPDGKCVLHKCGVAACVELSHLYMGTKRDNAYDSVKDGTHPMARKTECKRGHLFTEENTYIDSSHPGTQIRTCRTCKREAMRSYRVRKG